MKRSPVKIVAIAFFFLCVNAYQTQAETRVAVGCTTTALVAAINTANSTPAADTLDLPANCIYIFNSAFDIDPTNSDSALPKITTSITINGNGATIKRANGAPILRLLYVASTGDLTLNDTYGIGGSAGASGFGGGIYNDIGTLTVSNSTIAGNSASLGGGIYNGGGTLTVTNSTLSGNSASLGGGLYNSGPGTLTVTNSTLSGNSASSGGGIFNGFGTLTVTNSTLADNTGDWGGGLGGSIQNNGTAIVTNSTLSGNSASIGGGIYNFDSLTVTNSTLSGNSARGVGGGIFNDNGATATVTNSTLSGNNAEFGGGTLSFGTLTVTNSTISGNSVNTYGGGIYNYSGTATVTNSTISGNSANNEGGGIFSDGTLTVTNSTIAGNSASSGGGIFNSFATLTVTNSTIAGNSASSGGGIFNNNTAAVTNSIVWGNSSQIQNSGAITINYSDVEGGGFAGTGNLDADLLFVSPVAHASAPTMSGDYRLQAGSPALNQGSNAALPADAQDLDGDGDTAEPIPYDRDGNARIVNGVVDMGAYEHQTKFAAELLDNGGFETPGATNAVPASWTVKNNSGDKRLCKVGKPHSGLCAFKFAGSVGENAQLSQTVDINSVTIEAGDTLTLSAWLTGNDPSAKTKLVLSVTYTGNPTSVKAKLVVKRNAAYTQHTMPVVNVTGAVTQIKVAFKHKSTAGKLYVDTASLLHIPAGLARRSDLLPPPPAPDGMRGFN